MRIPWKKRGTPSTEITIPLPSRLSPGEDLHVQLLFSYYDVLEIPKNASLEQIKDAYRSLAKKYHPDVSKNSAEAVEQFTLIQEAYRVLSDPNRRKRYDQELQAESNSKAEGLLVLRNNKDDVLPKHADNCSCSFCVEYWFNNPDQYHLIKPYASLHWYRKGSNLSEDLTRNKLLGNNLSLPGQIESLRKVYEKEKARAAD